MPGATAIVVGAGAFGAAIADRLARSDWEVTLVDQFEPGDPRASSGGESRLLRFSHGGDHWHASSAWRSRDLWRELDPELFVEAGVVWLAQRAGGWEDDSQAVLRELGIPVERLSVDQAAELLPGVAGSDLEFAVFEPAAGLLRAQDAVRALVDRARAHGARLVPGRAVPDGEGVLLDDGRHLAADRVIRASGAWLAALFPGLERLRVTLQELVFFEPPTRAWRMPPTPGWVDYDGAFYGTGDLDGHGVKVAPDVEGPEFDPRAGARDPSGDAVTRAREYASRRFPALANAPVIAAKTCQYELTADTRFIAAPHPEHASVWLLGGGSGHGFKHGPAMAERMAGALRGEEPMPERFRLGPRAAADSMRTAGSNPHPRSEPGT